MPSLVCLLLLISLAGLTKCDLVPLQLVAEQLNFIQPLNHEFSLGGTETMLCATESSLVTSTGIRRDLVLLPSNLMLHNGTYLIEGENAEFNQENKVCYFGGAFCFMHVSPRAPDERDRLVIRTTTAADNLTLTLPIQYIPPESDTPFNLTFDYGPRGISFYRSTSSLDNFSPSDSLFFRIREIMETSLCKRLENGDEDCQQENGCFVDVTEFAASTPMGVGSCIIPGQSISLFERVVMLASDRVEPGLRRLVMIEGQACVNSPQRMSEIINVTVVQNVPTPPTNSTTPLSTSPASPGPPATDGRILIISIVVVIAVLVFVTLTISVMIGVFCVKNRHKQNSTTPQDEFKMEDYTQEKQQDKEMTPEEKPEEEIQPHREVNKYVPYTIPSPTVSGIVFVSNDSTQSYKDLEEELLYQHRCDRIHPVAGPPDHTPDWMSRWRGIASRLKEETCLVYVIWSGSLESTTGTHDPSMRQVFQSLVRPLHKNTTDRESVNHRLILLQLGSKGTKDYLATDLCTKVFWKDSAEDPGFNIKECASFVCKTVNSIIIEKERQIQNNKSNLSAGRGKMEVDGYVINALALGESSDGKTHASDSADSKPVTESQLKEHLNTLFGKFSEKNDEVIKHVDDVGKSIEHVDEKLDEHFILPEGELPTESYA